MAKMITSRLLSSILVLKPCPVASRMIHSSSVLFAEPLKKKKKLDINLVKMRAERRVKKLEKEIKKLKKTAKQLKPLDEYQLPVSVMKDLGSRKRAIEEGDEQVEREIEKLSRIWIAYRGQERIQEQYQMRRIVKAQEKALHFLKMESPQLYKSSLEVDPDFLPFVDDHIVKETPRIEGYNPPDGVKTNVTKEWKM